MLDDLHAVEGFGLGDFRRVVGDVHRPWCGGSTTTTLPLFARRLVVMDSGSQRRAERDGSSAWRRRQRRLRSWWRHEQQSIAMALASALHHSADKTTRAQHDAPRGQKNAGTEHNELSDEDEVPARGSRPPCLGEPREAQDKVQQRTMEQIADVPMLTLLDSPVPQMVDQLVAVLARCDMPLADQVIEVPKVSCLLPPAVVVLFSVRRRRWNSW